MPIALEVADEARRDTLKVGVLDLGRERVVRHAPQRYEGLEVAALPSSGVRSSTVPAGVCQSRSRWPSRCTTHSAHISPVASAPTRAELELDPPLGPEADISLRRSGQGSSLRPDAGPIVSSVIVGPRSGRNPALMLITPSRGAGRSPSRNGMRAHGRGRSRGATRSGGTRLVLPRRPTPPERPRAGEPRKGSSALRGSRRRCGARLAEPRSGQRRAAASVVEEVTDAELRTRPLAGVSNERVEEAQRGQT